MHKELLNASKHIQKVYDRLCNKVYLKYGLSKLELAVLTYLDANPDCTARDITVSFQISKSAISQAIDALMKKEMIYGRQSENDRRYVVLELREAAKAVLEENEKVNAEFIQIITKGIDAFQRVVRHMIENIKEASKEIRK